MKNSHRHLHQPSLFFTGGQNVGKVCPNFRPPRAFQELWFHNGAIYRKSETFLDNYDLLPITPLRLREARSPHLQDPRGINGAPKIIDSN